MVADRVMLLHSSLNIRLRLAKTLQLSSDIYVYLIIEVEQQNTTAQVP